MENKVLCGCHDVTMNDVKSQIKLGVKSFEELQSKTGIGTDCEPCMESNKILFNDLLQAVNID